MDVKGVQRIWSCQGLVEMGGEDLEVGKVPTHVQLHLIYPTWGHIKMGSSKITVPLVLITVQVLQNIVD